jgi:hypothetical protein
MPRVNAIAAHCNNDSEVDNSRNVIHLRTFIRYVVIFAAYGFFVNFKPSEANLVPYLINDKGFTNKEV